MELYLFMQYTKDTGSSDNHCELDEGSKPSWSKIENARQLS